jgi:hypothetical protein
MVVSYVLCTLLAGSTQAGGMILQVCMHLTASKDDPLGKCVRATARFVPSFSTMLDFVDCTNPGCKAAFAVASGEAATAAAAFEQKYGLPEDPMWTETYNGPLTVQVSLREVERTNFAILFSGILSTVVAIGAVTFGRALYARHLKSL